jgi:hypothetical protein
MDLLQPPTTPDGAPLDEVYWQKIMGDVNRCGDRFLDLMSEYQHDHFSNTYKLARCADSMDLMMAVYGKVPFAINVVVFYESGAEVGHDVFCKNIRTYHDTMDEDLMFTVERLRYINTKFQERMKTIAGQLRGRGIAFKKN